MAAGDSCMKRPEPNAINQLFALPIALRRLACVLVLAGAPAWADPPPLEDRRYEDNYTFKHGRSYVQDPYVWGYTKEFAERFRMPAQWIEPELKGALAVAFRMTAIGNTTCGLGGKADNCWKPLDCQLDIYYDSKINLPWNYPEIIRDNVMRGLSSSEYLYDAGDSKGVRRYVYEKDRSKPRGIMNSGGGFQHGKFGQGAAFIRYFDREYEPGVGLISYIGVGFCPPQYTGPDPIYSEYLDKDDVRRWSRGQLALQDARVLHRIEFPQTFLARARAAYAEGNKPNEATQDQLIQQFMESRRKGAAESTRP